jgi:hypothetical protein
VGSFFVHNYHDYEAHDYHDYWGLALKNLAAEPGKKEADF